MQIKAGNLKQPERFDSFTVRFQKKNLHATTKVLAVKAKTASACSCETAGNHSTKSSTVAPASRFSKRADTGTRVPQKTQAPLTLSGSLSTCGH